MKGEACSPTFDCFTFFFLKLIDRGRIPLFFVAPELQQKRLNFQLTKHCLIGL